MNDIIYKAQLLARHEDLKGQLIALSSKYNANYEHCKRFGIRPSNFLFNLPIPLDEFDMNTDVQLIQRDTDTLAKSIEMLQKALMQLNCLFILISYGTFFNLHAIPSSMRKHVMWEYPDLYDRYARTTVYHNLERSSARELLPRYENIWGVSRREDTGKRVTFSNQTKLR